MDFINILKYKTIMTFMIYDDMKPYYISPEIFYIGFLVIYG
jgi:hypothetical protein